jgi:hypothetical protein
MSRERLCEERMDGLVEAGLRVGERGRMGECGGLCMGKELNFGVGFCYLRVNI